MNFLVHLHLAAGDEGLMMGALLGDFVRGREALQGFPPAMREGIVLHRWIDGTADAADEIRSLRGTFPREFRRYAGIIIDLAFDHELARRWSSFSSQGLAEHDAQVRALLAAHADLVPARLARFMAYADRRGLFASYRHEAEMLHSLAGIGTRLSRPNPLHRVEAVWPALRPAVGACFEAYFPVLQSRVAAWRRRRSTSTGSWSEAPSQNGSSSAPGG
ncbi:MAG: DUF479 domain-containing protein [Xanthomonadales bacterium]|nr:DUF479 domain-containing protein [Xanthomonadales bacterium]NIN59606.1 DUF479 domain-containing protein [Xanthomonadales bacterium]NIN75010.1 DUF479 domain-containing protein [Xanthomonadales bacterium]NIO14104.1 DUF479 domain-containing protein [Xanthomonadales bacterium]NIP11999.1 DUF479 domain-containing protein [Xanthomonadales bacterium]